MQTAQKPPIGKNELWAAYQDAGQLLHAEILLELKKANLYRHFQTVASKEGYNLLKAQGNLRDIFIRLLPDTAPLFGLPAPKKATAKTPKVPSPAPLFEQQS